MDLFGFRITRVAKSQKRNKKIETKVDLIKRYLTNGKKPWSEGYIEYKWDQIHTMIHDQKLLNEFKIENQLPAYFGIGIDERIVEYPWIFSKLLIGSSKILDAGSTFNFTEIITHPLIKNKDLTIFTYFPETKNFNEKRVSYVYGDLRDMPFRNNYYDQVISQSTIEHIDKDNSIYGYEASKVTEEKKSYEYLKAIKEFIRITKPGGSVLLTFPYGKFEDHGFFQQFDHEMLQRVIDEFDRYGKLDINFMLYSNVGWSFSSKSECENSESFNPHTGRGKGEDGAAHCRCICVVKFEKHK